MKPVTIIELCKKNELHKPTLTVYKCEVEVINGRNIAKYTDAYSKEEFLLDMHSFMKDAGNGGMYSCELRFQEEIESLPYSYSFGIISSDPNINIEEKSKSIIRSAEDRLEDFFISAKKSYKEIQNTFY